jgi:hypothetical protein
LNGFDIGHKTSGTLIYVCRNFAFSGRDGTNRCGSNSSDFDALRATAPASRDSNSRNGHIQTRRQKFS